MVQKHWRGDTCFQCECLISLQSLLLQPPFGCQKMFVRCLMTKSISIRWPLWSVAQNAPSTKSLPISITKLSAGEKNTLQFQWSQFPLHEKWTQVRCGESLVEPILLDVRWDITKARTNLQGKLWSAPKTEPGHKSGVIFTEWHNSFVSFSSFSAWVAEGPPWWPHRKLLSHSATQESKSQKDDDWRYDKPRGPSSNRS